MQLYWIIIINSRVSGTIYDNGTMRASSPTQSIPQLVKSLKILITKEIGFSLFQRSYHDHIIRNEIDRLRMTRNLYTMPAAARQKHIKSEG